MQPYSEVPSSTTKTTASTSARNSIAPNPKSTVNSSSKINLKSPNLCKLVKGKKPLINFNFYLDIKDQQISKKVEERITELGGTLEFFLTKSVTHFITDRSNPVGQQPNNGSSNQNGYCVRSPAPGAATASNSGGVGGGGGGGGIGIGIGYPKLPSPYIQSPQTPATPQTPHTNHTLSGDSATDGVAGGHSRLGSVAGITTTPNNKKKISRADAMLHRALQSQQQTQSANPKSAHLDEEKRPNLEPGTYAIWSLDYAIRFLKKVIADQKQYAKKSQQPTRGACEPILLKGHFIKIESIKRSARPYYSVFRKIEWPKIQFKEDGAFRLSPKDEEPKSAKDKPSKTNAMTRKSRSSSKHNHNHMRLKAKQAPKQTEKPATTADESSEKQCGVCEICKIEYDRLPIHLKTKDHEFFARNQTNYIALDTLIKTSANVDKFLDENTKVDPKQEPLELMEVDEEVTRQTRQSSRIQTPPPPLKIKTKLRDIEPQPVVTDKKPTHNNVRKKSTVPLDSPPIRHPLPTSTIYKVVDDGKPRTEPAAPQTSSIIVKFRKIRQTELSLLNGEAENFMFPKRPASSECATDSDRQTSTDSNRISSSSISSESHSIDDHIAVADRSETEAAKRRRIATGSRKSTTAGARTTASTSVISAVSQSFPNAPIQPSRTSRTTRDYREVHSRQSITPKPTTRRRRRCVGSRRGQRGTSRNQRQEQRQLRQRCASEDRMGEHDGIEGNEEEDNDDSKDESSDGSKGTRKSSKKKKLPPPIDVNQGRIKDQKYAFERLPMQELWFGVFQRQDACQERMFEYWGSTSYRKLPYEMGPIPIRTLAPCKLCTPHPVEVKKEPRDPASVKSTKRAERAMKKIKKEKMDDRSSKSGTPDPEKASKSHPRIRNKLLNKATFLSYDLMPRKSPREHASTLAILSCLIKQRQDSEVDEPPPTPKEKTPEKLATPKRKTPSPAVSTPRIDTPEPLQFGISENVKRLRRGQRKFDDFIPTKPTICPVTKQKPKKPKGGLEFELDEKRLRSLEAKEKSSKQLEQEIDAYLGRIAVKSMRLTPSPPPTDSSGFVDDFSSDFDLIDLVECYDGGGGGGCCGEVDEENSIDQPVHRPASCNVFSFFSAHNRRRKNIKANKTGWPKKRRNIPSMRQNHLLQKPERYRLLCDYQTRQKNRLLDSNSLVATSMTPPDTDLDDCTRSPAPVEEVVSLTPIPVDGAIHCKEEILNNGYMSPSEKADNSDIFTVSSDGLDTDLDVSCSQIKTEDIDDECTTSSTLAAPPATPEPGKVCASPQSNSRASAITTIMKKEVKVTCKRLRTPFRRFRQRR